MQQSLLGFQHYLGEQDSPHGSTHACPSCLLAPAQPGAKYPCTHAHIFTGFNVGDHANNLKGSCLCDRGQTCGQLKVTIRAPGAEEPLVGRPQPSNTTSYLDSCSSAMPPSPSAGRRLRADISSIAAPKHAAHHGGPSMGTAAHQDNALMGTTAHQDHPLMGSPVHQRARSVGQHRSNAELKPGRASQQTQAAGKLDSADTDSHSEAWVDPCTDALGMPAPVHQTGGDPKLQLGTQMQQLRELSHLLSQRLALSDCLATNVGPEAAKGRAGTLHGPMAAASGPSSGAVLQDGAMGSSQGVHIAQRTQRDSEEMLGNPTPAGDPLSSAEAPQEAAAAFEPSTGIAHIADLILALSAAECCKAVGVHQQVQAIFVFGTALHILYWVKANLLSHVVLLLFMIFLLCTMLYSYVCAASSCIMAATTCNTQNYQHCVTAPTTNLYTTIDKQEAMSLSTCCNTC